MASCPIAGSIRPVGSADRPSEKPDGWPADQAHHTRYGINPATRLFQKHIRDCNAAVVEEEICEVLGAVTLKWGGGGP